MTRAIWMSMLVATLVTAVRPASACSTSYPDTGLTLDFEQDYPVIEGGAMLVRAGSYAVDVDVAMADLLLWEVRRDGVVQPGAFEVVPLFDAEATSVTPEAHVFALLWRPDAPFTAGGAYTLDFQVADPHESTPVRVTLEVVAPPPLEPPPMTATATTVAVDPTETVCCESHLGSCGDSYQCEVTRATLLPAIDVRVGLKGIIEVHRVVWVAPVLPGGEIGPRVQGPYAQVTTPWSWEGTIRFDAPADEYCVVVGATSVIDGSDSISEPRCFGQAELGVPHEGSIALSTRMTPFVEGDYEGGRCLGPLVYEADGAAYPREAEQPEASGCSVTSPGPWSLLLLALIRRRRARA